MSQDTAMERDGRLSALLRQAAPAPAACDALFRLQAMERRERDRFRRRIALTVAAGAVAAIVALTGLLAGGEVRMAASVALIAFALAMGGMTAATAKPRQFRFPGV